MTLYKRFGTSFWREHLKLTKFFKNTPNTMEQIQTWTDADQ